MRRAGRLAFAFVGAALPLAGLAANNQVWLKQSAEVPVVDLWEGGRLAEVNGSDVKTPSRLRIGQKLVLPD